MLSPDFSTSIRWNFICIQSFTFWKKTFKLMEFSSVSMPHRGASTTANSGLHQKLFKSQKHEFDLQIYFIYIEFPYYILIYLKWLNYCRCCNTCRIKDKLNYVNTLWYYLFYLKMFYHVQKCVVYKKMIHVAVLYFTDLPYLSLTMMKLLPS